MNAGIRSAIFAMEIFLVAPFRSSRVDEPDSAPSSSNRATRSSIGGWVATPFCHQETLPFTGLTV